MTDGFPISACVARPDIGDSFEPGDHHSTFGVNPVSAAAALANIDVMLKVKLPEQAAEKGSYIMKCLKEMKEKYEIIGDIRGKSLMIGIELVKNREKKTPAENETRKNRDFAREQGLLIGSEGVRGCVLRIQPPPVSKKSRSTKTLDILEPAIRKANSMV